MDLLSQRSKRSGLINRLVKDRNNLPSFCSENCSTYSKSSGLSNPHINERQLFKVPEIPSNYHAQERNQNQSMMNSTISQSSMKYAVDSLRTSFFDNFQSYFFHYENGFIKNDERALLIYTELNSILSNAMKKMSNKKGETNDEIHPEKVLGQIAKAVKCIVPNVQTINHTTTSTLTSDLRPQPQLDPLLDDFIHFSEDLIHSTQMEFQEDQTRDRNQNRTQQVKMGLLNQKKTESGKSLFSNLFDNYSNIDLKKATASTSKNVMNEEISNPKNRFSPDLSQHKFSSSKTDKNSSRLDTAKLKATLTQRLDNTPLSAYKPITNWTIRQCENSSRVELFGCDPRSKNSTPVSHGIVLSRKGDGLIRTTKGLFNIVGSLKPHRELPRIVKKQFKTDFPLRWRKALNDSGIFK